MTDLTAFYKTELSDDHTAADVNKLIAASLRSEHANTETLTATKVLTDADTPFQILTASGASRDVKLASEASSNHPTYIHNGGGSNNIVVKDDSGATTLKTLAPGEGAFFVSVLGVTWKEIGGGSGGSTASFWTTFPGTPVRASNNTFTNTGDYSSPTAYPFGKGLIIKWTESGVVKCGMISIPPTYGAPNTTHTFIGDTMASIDSGSLKYASMGAEVFLKEFVYAGTIGATGTDVARAYYATEPMRVIGADISVGTAGTTNNTTIDLNKNGTTMFTTKPTLATTVASSPTPFTADSATSLALGDKVTMDVDAIQTTAAIDLYVPLYLFPTRYLYL